MRGLAVLGACLLIAAPVFAADPPDMAASARAQAKAAPERLNRQTLGRSVFRDYSTVKFRNVRAHYVRSELVNDQIYYCGEVDTKDAEGRPTGWIRFAYVPGDPPEFATERADIGNIRQIGPHVLKNACEGQKTWLEGEFSADFNAKPSVSVASQE